MLWLDGRDFRELSMGTLLSLTPLAVFVALERFAGPTFSLATSTMVSASLVLKDLLRADRQLKLLKVVSFFLLAGLTLFIYTPQLMLPH
jgi:hypothetical protein